ncbi:hypothetical protein [Alkalimarinus sediminis]|uniref:Uncharacterized protein n=1 Tax=Alkalimarinus sediminis TaxID=1632866 RepID=A0A9E8HKU2_9ALTE|nr:hypothetical protein [Alkalimarinus sediminis]UZW76284.1 hypothetical protein NNL22_06790 [Alkalimarinus sediminis]
MKFIWLKKNTETIIGPEENYWLDINRLRLGLSESWENLEVDIIYDNEIQLGSYLDTFQFRQFAEMDDHRYWDLQGNTLDKDNVYGTHQLYRGTVRMIGDNADLRVGRQQINWSTAVIWNPLDRFNPLNPLQLERDERTGVDSVLLDYNVQDLSRLSIAYAPQHESSDSSAAIRFKSNIDVVDWSTMVGEFINEKKIGLGLAGQAGLIGLRSEVVFSDSDKSDEYVEVVLSADYTTNAGIKLVLEGYFNGDGVSETSQYQFSNLLNGQKLGLAKRYLGGIVSKEITALTTIELIAIGNLDDQSLFFYPSVEYNVPGFEDLYIKIGAQIFNGNDGTEYGFFSDLYFTELKYYF